MVMPRPPFPGPFDPGKVIETIVRVGKAVWGALTGRDRHQEELGREKALNPAKAEADEIAALNQLLNEFRQNIITATDALERELIAECSMYFSDVMKTFERSNESLKVYRAEVFDRKFRQALDDMKGTFSSYITRRISLDDAQCVKALKLPAGELKTQRLQELKIGVFQEGTNEIIRKAERTMDDFIDTIEYAFCNRLDHLEETAAEKKKAFQRIAERENDTAQEIESVISAAMYAISLCEYADMLI